MYRNVEVLYNPHILNVTTDTGEHAVARLPAESASRRKEGVFSPESGFILLRRDVVSA